MAETRCCGSVSQKKSLDIWVRLRKRASLSRSDSSASLRRRNCPTWLPMTRAACWRRSSGELTLRPENTSTPMVLPPETTPKANTPCREKERNRKAAGGGGARGGAAPACPADPEGDHAVCGSDARADRARVRRRGRGQPARPHRLPRLPHLPRLLDEIVERRLAHAPSVLEMELP